jgi:hypothetical protein
VLKNKSIMVNAQEWLDKNYPNKQETKEIKLDYREQVQGKLTISDYLNLERINIISQENLTQLQINDCPQLKQLIAQYSQLTNLDLTGVPNLEKLHLSSNSLTNLDLSNNLGLEELDITNNNFPEQDLSWLSHLVNLKRLDLGNDKQERIGQGIYNHFKGSLEPLENLSELEKLNINDTDIDSGLEYLPESVENFKCSPYYRLDAKVKVIFNLFANEQGEIETDGYGITNFPQKLRDYEP